MIFLLGQLINQFKKIELLLQLFEESTLQYKLHLAKILLFRLKKYHNIKSIFLLQKLFLLLHRYLLMYLLDKQPSHLKRFQAQA